MAGAAYRAARSLLAALALGQGLLACSLGNVSPDACLSEDECSAAFGLGSSCREGFCSEPASCQGPADCRAAFGYGAACDAGRCVAAPADARCQLVKPAGDSSELGRPMKGLAVGAIFSDDSPNQQKRAEAVREAIRRVNGSLSVEPVKLVSCTYALDRGDSEVTELTTYLGSALGLPLFIGPSSSRNVTLALQRILKVDEPIAAETAILTPSASSVSLSTANDRPAGEPATRPGILWRTCPSDAYQAARLAEHVGSLEGVSSVAIVRIGDSYGESYGSEFAARFKEAGGTSTPYLYAPRDPDAGFVDLSEAVDQAAAGSHDGVLVVAPDGGTALAVLVEIADRPSLASLPVFLTDGAKDKGALLDPASGAVKELLRGAVGVAPGIENPALLTPDLLASDFGYIAHSWDAAHVAVLGLKYAASKAPPSDGAYLFTGVDVAEGFSRLSAGEKVELAPTSMNAAIGALTGSAGQVDVVGASGELTFDERGDVVESSIELWKPNADLSGFETVEVPDPGAQ